MYRVDCHLHSAFSFDSEEPMVNIVEAAIRAGLDEICFTDHLDFTYPAAELLNPLDFGDYLNSIERVKQLYDDRLRINRGIEIGIGEAYAERIAGILGAFDFDFVIGSFHDYKGIDIYYPDFWQDKDKHTAHRLCLEETLRAVPAVEGFHVLGHLDYMMRYGPYRDKSMDYSDHAEIIDEILRTLISLGKGIEVNTSGYKYGLGNPHPAPKIVRRYRELGGEIITVGSDAHSMEHVGSRYDDAIAIIEEAGFKHITVFRKGKPCQIDIL